MSKFIDDYQTRLAAGNDALLEAYQSLDPASPTYYEDLKSVATLAEHVNEDFDNFASKQQEALALKEEKSNNLFRNIIAGSGILVTLTTFLIGEHGRNKRIDKVTAYEEDNAILKSSEKIAVRDSITDDNKRSLFNFFNR